MKKLLIILITLCLVIIFSIMALKIKNDNTSKILKKYNDEYQIFYDKTISGAELATLINKAVNQNEKNKIQKDEKKHYIENDENSIKIDIKLLLTEKTYPMEEFYKNDTSEFVKYYELDEFKCTNIEYHNKTGKIKKLIFVQLDNSSF